MIRVQHVGEKVMFQKKMALTKQLTPKMGEKQMIKNNESIYIYHFYTEEMPKGARMVIVEDNESFVIDPKMIPKFLRCCAVINEGMKSSNHFSPKFDELLHKLYLGGMDEEENRINTEEAAR